MDEEAVLLLGRAVYLCDGKWRHLPGDLAGLRTGNLSGLGSPGRVCLHTCQLHSAVLFYLSYSAGLYVTRR